MRFPLFAMMLASYAVVGGSVSAEGLHIVRPLPGYTCMTLNITDQQSMDFSFHVPVREAPSDTAPVVGWAGANVAVRTPAHVENGFLETLFPTGRTVWIAENMLRPYRSLSNPQATCTPALLSNGKPGFDFR